MFKAEVKIPRLTIKKFEDGPDYSIAGNYYMKCNTYGTCWFECKKGSDTLKM